MGSFSLSGGVEVFGFISPSDTTDTYPVIDPLYGIDGLRNVDLLSDLNTIPTLRRRAGMVVGVSGGTTYYKLNLPPWTNTLSDWSIFNSGGSSGGTLSGDYLPLSGGTVSGGTQFTNGLSANTISATTYFNLPTDVFVTGGTYIGNTITFTNNTGGTFNVTGITSSSSTTFTGGTVSGSTIFTNGLSANTISATTYQNLPTDIRVTGGTFSNGTLTFTNNTGGTFNVTGVTSADTFTTAFTYSNNIFTINRNQNLPALTATINSVTGWTINGNLIVTGTTSAGIISATTLTIGGTSTFRGTITATTLSGTTSRMVEASSTGELTANSSIITGYITSGGTAANLLENTSNWDINGVYTGATITGTYQGQKHYNGNYFFEAVGDNLFIRLIRG